MDRRTFLAMLAAASSSVPLAACAGGNSGPAGGGAGGGSGKIKVAYQVDGTFTQLDTLLKKVKTQFEAQNSGSTLELVPIKAAQNDYITKLALMNRSPSTAPDIMYEDTFMIRSDVGAGYLMPLDDHLGGWADWAQFEDAAKAAGRGDDGKTYGISLGTDTRGIWYNRQLLAKAGITGDFKPASWAELLDAARKVKASSPGITPLNIYSGKAAGEAAVMQGFEMLLYGTQGGTLYLEDQGKWVVGSAQFKAALDFIRTVYTEGLAPTPQVALDTNIGSKVAAEWLPKGKVAIAIDGSWLPSAWLPGGEAVWPEWSKTLGWTAMPTQSGQAPGRISMSGGWTLAMGANCKSPELAFKVMQLAFNRENALWMYINDGGIAVRKDCSSDPTYLKANPSVQYFTDLVEDTKFRPATADYPNISNAIGIAMEAVMTGQQSVEQAAAAYDKAVEQQVTKDKTVTI